MSINGELNICLWCQICQICFINTTFWDIPGHKILLPGFLLILEKMLFFSETPMLDSIWPIALLHFTTEKMTREMSDFSGGLNKGLLLGKLSWIFKNFSFRGYWRSKVMKCKLLWEIRKEASVEDKVPECWYLLFHWQWFSLILWKIFSHCEMRWWD